MLVSPPSYTQALYKKKIKFLQTPPPPKFFNGVLSPPPPPVFPLQPEADPSEALWRKRHARMTDFGTVRILRTKPWAIDRKNKRPLPRTNLIRAEVGARRWRREFFLDHCDLA